MFSNSLQMKLNSILYECEMLPLTLCPTEYYEMTFNTVLPISISLDCENFEMAVNLCSEYISQIALRLKDSHVFEIPQFSFTQDMFFKIRIGVMTKEIYDKIMKSMESKV